MYCPETIIACTNSLYIVRHDGHDYHGPVPWRIRLNPLRYEVAILRFTRFRLRLNKDAWLFKYVDDLTWRLWRERAFNRRHPKK